jgi:hypothetical protein
MSRWPVRQRIQYKAKSYSSYNTGFLWGWESAALQTPWDTNPQAVSLARKWRSESKTSAGVVDSALRYFQNNDFNYTLNPPPLGDKSIDDFLFKTRKGYCEHYASAFAYLMRVAGVPARIVAGYLGGKLNPYGKYLIVRQADAHVWVEVWLSGKGWLRVDPTLAVAPERIEQGAAAALPPEERATLRVFDDSGWLSKYWTNLELGWDAISNQWNKWILGYSNRSQKSLFAHMGIKTGTETGLATAILLCSGLLILLTLFYFLRIFNKPSQKMDVVQRSYLRFCAKLDRIGLSKNPAQGPLDYTEMVIAVRNDLNTKVAEIVTLYITLRYGRGGSNDDLKRLKVLVRQFDP